MALIITKKHSSGFSLVELMVVLVILGIVSVGTITAITSQNRVYHSEEDLIDAQMNARIAADRISFLLRMAGTGCSDSFGKKLDTGNLATIGGTGIAANPTTSMFVIDDNSVGTPDQLTLVGAVRYVGNITSIPANNQIKLQCNETPKIDGTATKKYIFITPQDENRYRTISGIAGTTTPTLTLSTILAVDEKKELDDALTAGVVLDVYQVQAFTIRLVDSDNIRSLRIDGNAIASSTEMNVADNIQDLQFQYGIDTTTPKPDGQIDSWVDNPTDITQIRAVRFFILARTSKIDKEYTDTKTYDIAGGSVGPFNDHTHRYLLESTIAIRNRNYN
ncbi:MAG TPA: prepilin-type N-terminal cleavage/methylation domain-containing protein [Desulfarculaceae bacterium]|nr:prepilin-type N-terminal cleavage/methylation domain-containing protein [Desulfarculaceae bacterium]